MITGSEINSCKMHKRLHRKNGELIASYSLKYFNVKTSYEHVKANKANIFMSVKKE